MASRAAVVNRSQTGRRCESHRIEGKGWRHIASGLVTDNDAEVECRLLGEDGETEKTLTSTRWIGLL